MEPKVLPIYGNKNEPLALRLRKVQVAHQAAVEAGRVKDGDWPEYYAECLGDNFIGWQVAAYNPCDPHPCDPEAEMPSDQDAEWTPYEVKGGPEGYD